MDLAIFLNINSKHREILLSYIAMLMNSCFKNAECCTIMFISNPFKSFKPTLLLFDSFKPKPLKKGVQNYLGDPLFGMHMIYMICVHIKDFVLFLLLHCSP